MCCLVGSAALPHPSRFALAHRCSSLFTRLYKSSIPILRSTLCTHIHITATVRSRSFEGATETRRWTQNSTSGEWIAGSMLSWKDYFQPLVSGCWEGIWSFNGRTQRWLAISCEDLSVDSCRAMRTQITADLITFSHHSSHRVNLNNLLTFVIQTNSHHWVHCAKIWTLLPGGRTSSQHISACCTVFMECALLSLLRFYGSLLYLSVSSVINRLKEEIEIKTKKLVHP